jgi:hypothetical protein
MRAGRYSFDVAKGKGVDKPCGGELGCNELVLEKE